MIKDIKFEKITEGKCVQVLHIGPYSTEPQTIEKMRKMMKENKLTENGFHHEIYLSDQEKLPSKNENDFKTTSQIIMENYRRKTQYVS